MSVLSVYENGHAITAFFSRSVGSGVAVPGPLQVSAVQQSCMCCPPIPDKSCSNIPDHHIIITLYSARCSSLARHLCQPVGSLADWIPKSLHLVGLGEQDWLPSAASTSRWGSPPTNVMFETVISRLDVQDAEGSMVHDLSGAFHRARLRVRATNLNSTTMRLDPAARRANTEFVANSIPTSPD